MSQGGVEDSTAKGHELLHSFYNREQEREAKAKERRGKRNLGMPT